MASGRQTTLGGALVLADEGSFFVNGAARISHNPGATAPAGRITTGQMHVQYRVPADRRGAPIVMVHGSNHTGACWETTPDGREGWATWFTRQGHPVYVVDHVGRGRSGFDPTPINAVRDGASDASTLPPLVLGTLERSWANYRFGPAYPTPFANLQFPLEALEQYLAQLVPNSEATLPQAGGATVEALVALLDRIGPAVLMVHSQSGLYGLDVVRKRPALVLGLVSLEGGCETMTAADASGPFANVPLISVFGDNSIGLDGIINGDIRRNGCIAAVQLVQAAGGRAQFLMLPEAGIAGNSHMLMMDRNNIEVAELVRAWIVENVTREDPAPGSFRPR